MISAGFCLSAAICMIFNVHFATIDAQLDQSQHSNLMKLFDETDCAASLCPRFAVNEGCPNVRGLVCLNGDVTQVNMGTCMLKGSIPTEIGLLTALTYLHLGENQLIGSIPTQFGHLTALRHLYLSSNRLISSLPTELGNLGTLVQLRADNNMLTGTIPPQLTNLTLLQFLYLFENLFTGSIPDRLGQMTSLVHLRMHGNQLTGVVPSSLGLLTELVYLGLNRNLLVGTIPPLNAPLTSECDLRQTCLDCSTAPSRCSCGRGVMMCAITTEPNAKSTTEMILITGSTTNQQTSSTPVPSTSTSSDSFNFQTTTTTTTTTIASTSIVVESSTGTIGPTAAEPSLTQPAVPDNVALIAGAVGGSLCALLLIVVVVALLWRQRSRNDRREDSSGIDLPTSGTVATPSQSEYHAMPMLDANYDVGNLSTELTT